MQLQYIRVKIDALYLYIFWNWGLFYEGNLA